MHELTVLDLTIIVLYMIGMLLVGVWFVKRIKNTGDFYVAGRTLGPFVLTATVCASIIGGSAMMGRAGIAYTTGFKAIMTAIPYLIGMFIFSAIAGRIQEVGAARNINSIPELFHYRFSRNARCVLALMIVFTMMGTVAAQVTATATIIKMLGSEFGISYEAGALVATIIFIIYTAASGLFGVVYTDVLQFFMLIIFVYILIPISSVRYLGNFSVFWQNLDKSYLVPHINGSILGDIVTYLVFTLAGILSVMMSTADSYLLVSVQTFVHDLGKNFMPEMTEKHEILMSRIMSVVLAMGALIIALYIKNAYNVLMFAWSFYAAAAGLPALAALYWKKATNQGILSAMIGGFAVCVGWKLAGNPFGLGETVPGAVVCGLLLVTVSLATYKKSPCRMA